MDERRVCALLARAPGLCAQHVRAAIAQLRTAAAPPLTAPGREADGLATEALELIGAAQLLCSPAAPGDRLHCVPPRTRAYLAAPPESLLDADLRWLDASGALAVPCTSPQYPALLAATTGAPAVLYVLGDSTTLVSRQLAMVGARAATATGRLIAREIAGELVRAGLAVTSGLARGIDAASHEGALDAGGMTLAVCAHGLDLLYPRQHRGLAERIRQRGALISRFAPGTPPAPRRFPARNRVLSGLALATLVVEAAQRSGSLHTARFALQQGRSVFAVPGSVRNPLAAGCHALLRGGGHIAENASDVLRELGISLPDQTVNESEAPRSAGRGLPHSLDKGAEILLDALGFEPVSLNTLVERTGLPSSSITSMLLILELAGRVAPQPGGRYSRVS